MNFKKYHASRNLYNINAKDVNNGYVNNAQLNQDGITEPWNLCEVTEYIELTPNETYRLSNIGSYNSLAYCIYDSDKQYITGEKYSGQAVKEINMPSNGKYLRFSHAKSKTDTMLNEGSEALPYEPYSAEVWHDIPHYIYNASAESWQEVTDVHERISGQWD